MVGGHVLVAEQLLHRTNVLPAFKQMRGEAVAPHKSYAHAIGLSGSLLK
jgi:hypothetical protein